MTRGIRLSYHGCQAMMGWLLFDGMRAPRVPLRPVYFMRKGPTALKGAAW